MKNLIYLICLIVFTVVLFISCSDKEDNRSATQIAKIVADKIIRETTFVTKTITQEPVLAIQVLDYVSLIEPESNGTFYSLSNIICPLDTTIVFGLSYSGALSLFINDKPEYEKTRTGEAKFEEIAYNMFEFQDSVAIKLKKGKNRILIKLVQQNLKPIVYLRELQLKVEEHLTIKFSLNELGYDNLLNQWLSTGPFIVNNPKVKLNIKYPPEKEIESEFLFLDKKYTWQLIDKNEIEELVISESNSYKRESYLEWHYANGTVLFGLQAVSFVVDDSKYSDFISNVINYNLKNYELFKSQYKINHAFRGSNYRMFRKTMLDDTGAPALPYLEYYLNTNDKNVKKIIDDMNDYVTNKQIRLDDGTFCRPEPQKMTVWADDLYMSSLFLLRMGKLTGDTNYYDEVAFQVQSFYNLLFDAKVGLCQHGWFSRSNETTKVFWGRANGWMIWTVTEALLLLPEDHKDYSKILAIYKNHINGLIKHQGKNGLWHQVLDKPESFEETSCSAMFILAISRGIQNNWLEKNKQEIALSAWNNLKKNIMEDGTVKDICRGTGIGYDYDFYSNRKRFDNDPRGLGAVLTTATEMIKIGY